MRVALVWSIDLFCPRDIVMTSTAVRSASPNPQHGPPEGLPAPEQLPPEQLPPEQPQADVAPDVAEEGS